MGLRKGHAEIWVCVVNKESKVLDHQAFRNKNELKRSMAGVNEWLKNWLKEVPWLRVGIGKVKIRWDGRMIGGELNFLGIKETLQMRQESLAEGWN